MAKKSKTTTKPLNTDELLSKLENPHSNFITKAQVLERVCVTFPVVWQWIREKRFPPPRDVCGKALWLESEVEAWMKSRPVKKYKPLEEEAHA
jgi:predicted DNA-binding transcriptional regulator AlpA